MRNINWCYYFFLLFFRVNILCPSWQAWNKPIKSCSWNSHIPHFFCHTFCIHSFPMTELWILLSDLHPISVRRPFPSSHCQFILISFLLTLHFTSHHFDMHIYTTFHTLQHFYLSAIFCMPSISFISLPLPHNPTIHSFFSYKFLLPSYHAIQWQS